MGASKNRCFFAIPTVFRIFPGRIRPGGTRLFQNPVNLEIGPGAVPFLDANPPLIQNKEAVQKFQLLKQRFYI
jgi:hypothetical protein